MTDSTNNQEDQTMQGSTHIPPGIGQSDAGSFEVVTIDHLEVDHSYQRDLSADLVQKIADTWDMAAAGPIVVSRRADGSLWIVNGQHRAAGAKTAGETEILAQIVDFTHLPSDQARMAEATLRLKGNTRRTDKSTERFRAQVAAGDPESLAIVDICTQFETRMNPWPDSNHGINSVSAVERMYRKDKGVTLVRVFEVIQDSFGKVGGQNTTVSALKGIDWMLSRHDHEMQRRRLVERMKVEGADKLERMARSHRAAMGGALWMNYYRALVETYNHRLPQTSRLEWRTGGYTADPEYDSQVEAKKAAENRRLSGAGDHSTVSPGDPHLLPSDPAEADHFPEAGTS